MTFKPLLTGVAVTGLALGGLGLASVPAHAFTVGSQINTIGFGRVTPDGYDFFGFTGPGSDPGFTFSLSTGDIPSGVATVKDIPLLAAFTPIEDFIFFGTGAKHNFSLSEITPTISGNTLSIALKGLFADKTPGVGTLTTQLDGLSWSATITAGFIPPTPPTPVPTPALLPGLIGLGVAALRRKDEDTTKENA